MLVHSSTALARSRAQHTASPPSVHPVGWHVESRSVPSLQTMSISTRCNFKTFNIAPTPPPSLLPPGYICINWIYVIRTYTYVGLLPLPSSLAKAMPPQDGGRPQAPRRRRVALAVQAAPAPLLRPPKQPEQGIPRIGPPPAPPPAPRLPYPRPQQRVSDNKKKTSWRVKFI